PGGDGRAPDTQEEEAVAGVEGAARGREEAPFADQGGTARAGGGVTAGLWASRRPGQSTGRARVGPQFDWHRRQGASYDSAGWMDKSVRHKVQSMQMVKIRIPDRGDRAKCLIELARRGRVICLPEDVFVVPEPALALLQSLAVHFVELG